VTKDAEAIDFGQPLDGHLDETAACPHMAILVESFDDVAPALASFYALGARRNGWLFHRSLPGQADADRAGLTSAGLDVAGLEREDRLEISELPVSDPPESWAKPWVPVVERQLGRGFKAVWWSRFPVGPDEELFRRALVYDRYWDASFSQSQAVSLCVYVVGGLPEPERERRVGELRAVHDRTLLLSPEGQLEALPRKDT
jgi:hypothetical protein